MTERAQQLHAAVAQQIVELLDRASSLDDAALRRPFPGREKLGDSRPSATNRQTTLNMAGAAGDTVTSAALAAVI